MEATDQQKCTKLSVPLTGYQSTTILDLVEYRKDPQFPPRIYFGLLQSIMIPQMLHIHVHLTTKNIM